MNPQQSSPVPPQTAPTPQQQVHQRTRTPDEIRELGLVAVEEPQSAIPHADAAIPVSAFALPPQPAPAPTPEQIQPLPQAASPTVAPPEPSEDEQEVIVPLNQPVVAPAPPEPVPQTTLSAPAPVPEPGPTTFAPQAPPEYQPGPAPESVVSPSLRPVPAPPELQPVAMPPTAVTATTPSMTPSKAPAIAVPTATQQLDLPPLGGQGGDPGVQVSNSQDILSNNDRMEMSANSMQLRGVSRLHALNILLYLLIVALAIGAIVGGFYLRKYLVSGA